MGYHDIMPFAYNGKTVRTLLLDGEPWFVGKDVAVALGYSDTKSALSDHVDIEDKQIFQRGQNTTLKIPNRGLTIINESGLYSLILSSKLPTAKQFKRWVTSEVLPSIRKNGGYLAGQEEMADDAILAKAVLVAQKTIAERNNRISDLEAKIEQDKTKVLFADAVCAAKTSILIGELAKLLKQNGIEMGQNRLFDWLRENGYLIRRQGTDFNTPTQRSMELGLFEIKETVITHSDGHVTTNKTPKVTGKGQKYFVAHFLNAREGA